MKTPHKMLIALLYAVTSTGLKAQLKPDIGIRLSMMYESRLQLEFRQPLNTFYTLRLGASTGHFYSDEVSQKELILSDSLKMDKRFYSQGDQLFDIRCGVERKLKWDLISLHADLVLGYMQGYNFSSSNFQIRDEYGNWNYSAYPPESGLPDTYYTNPEYMDVTSKTHYVSTGLALGASLDVPFYRFIIGINAQAVGNMNIPVAHSYYNDPANELGSKNALKFNWYPSAGVALRYVLGSKQA
ncbi:MAG: hypothetical protein HYZ14_18440 [Bacteroidetes bacterium]|nr:hypothetical protein [Bacteroidota bacterium]